MTSFPKSIHIFNSVKEIKAAIVAVGDPPRLNSSLRFRLRIFCISPISSPWNYSLGKSVYFMDIETSRESMNHLKFCPQNESLFRMDTCDHHCAQIVSWAEGDVVVVDVHGLRMNDSQAKGIFQNVINYTTASEVPALMGELFSEVAPAAAKASSVGSVNSVSMINHVEEASVCDLMGLPTQDSKMLTPCDDISLD
ncbi:Aste57867_7844 [Aphanomyces stellatus]|uniref:Aste57867_7844 protein n=1 Tax=Aphanomyces stellatus TaxID=120398 RepID=A0A485KIT8_9STRA|nr:hypothetical protein As57867_007814 [Aphanomyces stellatus]VFT84739.1 Aste57867_7844 [Aphanomyces stellatus]